MWRLIACAVSLTLSSEVAAQDLGVRGPLFEIEEPSLFEVIAEKYRALEASGEAARMKEQLRERTLAKVHRPKPVEGIQRTEKPRSWRFDPSITLARDITLPDGRTLGRRGEKINPLHHTPMAQSLVFFDGDDEDQRAWARSLTLGDSLINPILVNGPVIELSRDWKRQLFFDQGGVLATRFGITQVPARVTRDGDHLLIEEVLP
jgi:conjugal transfer pilus assembly protein TraW